MSNLSPTKFLLARNEGKIKSFESCTDLRSWSHDRRVRDRHLREWMKSNTRVHIITVSELGKFLKTMTYKTLGKVSPRCQLDCKSKVVLDSICSSCNAMKLHLKSDKQFEKYFEEEGYETSQWPCDKCLDALKSIRMFWKIIVEKVYNINFSKTEETSDAIPTESVKSVAESWKSNIVKQTMLLKSMRPFQTTSKSNCSENKSLSVKSEYYPKSRRSDICGDSDSKTRRRSNSCKLRERDSNCVSGDSDSLDSGRRKRQHVGVSVRVKTVDFEGNTDKVDNEQEELRAHKTNIEYLQRRHNYQKTELNRLRKENTSLKFELQNVYKKNTWMSPFYSASQMSNQDDSRVPEPFEKCSEIQDDSEEPNNVNSEITITMKNFKSEDFKNVSLLQVVHKSNEPTGKDEYDINALRSNTQDPMNVLCKMHNTFGEIVKREMSIIKGKREISRRSEISASSHKAFKSVPSRTSLLSCRTSSNFMSTKDVSENELCFV